MGLKMKTFREILNNMVGWITTSNSKITNFYVGSVIRTILEAIAIELESIYFQMQRGFKFAIENSIFHSFNFYKFPATPSTGQVTIKFKGPLTQKVIIPKGYEFSTTPINGVSTFFRTTEDTQADFSATEMVLDVVCTEPGEVGNVTAYSIRRASISLAIVQEIYNSEAFLTGQEEETKEERKKRFTSYIDTLSKATVKAIHYGCIRVQGVTGAYVNEHIGMVDVYVHDASGNLPEELKLRVDESLLDYRAAGIQVNVLPVVKRTIDLSVNVELNPGFDKDNYSIVIHDSISSFFSHYTVSKSLIRAEVIRYIMSIDENAILNISISLNEDIEVKSYELVRAGVVTVNIL